MKKRDAIYRIETCNFSGQKHVLFKGEIVFMQIVKPLGICYKCRTLDCFLQFTNEENNTLPINQKATYFSRPLMIKGGRK